MRSLLIILLGAVACADDASLSARDSTRLASLDSSTIAGRGAPIDPTSSGRNVYAKTESSDLAANVRDDSARVYVPNSLSASLTVIDEASHRVLRTIPMGKIPQHVVPSWDLKTLWVLNNKSNTVTPIDPATGVVGAPVPVNDPYNMYFTPDGQLAIVVAEKRQTLDFRDPHTMQLVKSVHVPCAGLDHIDFTADDRYFLATCEFSAHVLKFDLTTDSVAGSLALAPSRMESMPQDIRSSPDGSVFYVADMKQDGIHLIDPVTMRHLGFVKTGKGAHGITPGRGGHLFYISNRGWNDIRGGPHGPGSVSVFDPKTQQVIATWPVPNGGSPDMGDVSADGKTLWLSGRYDDEAYAFDTATGKLQDRITVGRQPHGVCVWPQPGRYSLGHTGNMR